MLLSCFPLAMSPMSVSGWFFSRRNVLLKSLLTAAVLAVCILPGLPATAQTAHYGAVVTLGSGFVTPTGVTVDANGNVFVADNGNSAIKEILAVNGSIPASPTINTLGSGFSNPFTAAVDSSGNVYVTDYGNQAVKEIEAVNGVIPASPTIRTLVSGAGFIFGTAVDSQGDVFYTDFGADEVNEIVAVNGVIPSSPTIKTLGSGFNIPAGLAVDASGNVFVGDQDNEVVKEILALGGYTTVNTVATGFNTPDGIAIDAGGNIYVANDGANQVNEVLAVNGVIPASPTILTLGTGFSQPFDVAVDKNGNIYVADRGNNAVKEIQVAGLNFGPVNLGARSASALTLNFTFDTAGTLGSTAVLTQGATELDFTDAGGGSCTANTTYSAGEVCTVNVTFSPTAPGPRYGSVELLSTTGALIATGYVQGTGVGPQEVFATNSLGGLQPESQFPVGSGFSYPAGVAVDASKNVYVADSSTYEVQEITAASGLNSVVTLSSGFYFPNNIALDGSGNIFVTDTGNNEVKEIVAAGGYATVNILGSGFSNPYGITVDGSGNVYVADYENNAVKEMLAVNGSIPASPTIRTLASGLAGPDGVAVDGSGNVFVSNYNDGTVQEIVAVNGVIPAAPVINTIGTGFSELNDVAVDEIGNVYVADFNQNAVKEILAAGGYSTVLTLGSGFSTPEAVTVDAHGNVLVADPGDHSVQFLGFRDRPSQTFADTAVGNTSSDSPHTVTVTNLGTSPLVFALPTAGTSPSVPAGFTWDASSTCQQTTPSSPAPFQLAAGASCTMAFDFTPTMTGNISGFVVWSDNDLNQAGNLEAIQLVGNGTPGSQTINFTAPTSPVNYGVSPITLVATGGGSGNPVTFSIVSGPGWLGGSNNSVLTVTGIGTIVIAANQAGNAGYNAAPQITQSIVVSPPAGAALSSPASGSTLPGASATFTWPAASASSGYWLFIGTTGVGSKDLYDSGETNSTSITYSNFPVTGITIYVRLYTSYAGTLVHNDYTFLAAKPAVLTSPTPSGTLPGPSATFTWSAATGAGAQGYWLFLGTTGAGSKNLYDSGETTATSVTFNSLPLNGKTVYARVYTSYNGTLYSKDYTYTAAASAALTSPAPGTLPGPKATFTWSAATGSNIAGYWLFLGTTGVGSKNLYDSGETTATSATVSNLPLTGVTIYARVYTSYNGTLVSQDYTFTAAKQAVLTTPAPGGTLAGSTVTFDWSAATGSNIEGYWLFLGTTGAGSKNLYDSGETTATSATVSNLPTTGGTIYARVYTSYNGTLTYNDYTYTAQ